MKRILFGLIVICTAASSCKKDHKNEVKPPEGAAHKVSFNVGFSQSVTSFETTRLGLNSISPDTSLTNHIDVLYFMVFDSVGNSLHTVTQLTGDTTFGKFTDNLHPGKYTVVIAGGKTGLLIRSDNNISGSALDKAYIYYGTGNVANTFNQDAFYKKVSLVVTNANSNQGVLLDRIVSKISININDPIPAGAKILTAKINDIADAFYVGTGKPGVVFSGNTTLSYSANLTSSDIGTSNYQVSFFFLYNGPFSAVINCYSGDPGIPLTVVKYGYKTVPNITAQPNKVTILSGNLFGGNGSGGIQLSADTTWNTPIIRGF